ncbi:MAG TPA: energy transducer TonB [Thermoanaerobaculia bacterium]|jgi:TonB family protein|nr:energy transducer TonB [Thermoanaerobaculia bacterium]
MLETALLSTHSPARAHAVRVSLPAIVALHGAVLAGFIAASSLHDGEPPEPVTPIVFGTFGTPPPKGDGGPRPVPVAMHASHVPAPETPRLDRIPDAMPQAHETAADAAVPLDGSVSGDGESGGESGGTTPGSRDGVDGGDGSVDRPGTHVAGDADEPLVPGGAVTFPVLVHRVEPEYPRAAVQARSQGVVVLEAVITDRGDVAEVRILRSANPLLDDAAVRAVRQWAYRPATLAGRGVRVRLSVTVTFSIPSA